MAEERRERGARLCAKLAAEVEGIVPAGIGRWATAWEIVTPADAGFLLALTGWEADPTEAALGRVGSAYRAVISAWRYAADEYTSHQGVEQ